ncbi:MAG: sugar ABC transporter ATP-binding protein [Treponema sp.]|jgi:ABC-type sugar transport system ATPase subunit|nr:sugar ABC transporter ATP-binding protein [Treponema sp.]
MADDIILKIDHLSISFPGVKALDDVNFSICRRSIHALVGENGAGKSTLIKILAGIYQAETGNIILNGQNVKFKTPHEARLAGISVVHQEFKLSEPLSVTENIFLGRVLTKNGLVDWKTMRQKTRDMLAELNINIGVDEVVSSLSVAKKQIVEICKAINTNAGILIMDEPSATLTVKEQEIMFTIIQKLNKEGMTVIYISHRLEEVFSLAHYVTVLRDGKHIQTLPVKDVDRRTLISLMVGRVLDKEYPKEKTIPGETLLSVKGLTRKGVIEDINFHVRRGEILGIAGLVGSGRTETVRAVLGIDKIDSGEITWKNKPVVFRNFRQAIQNGLGLVPEERKSQGLVQILAIKENITMVNSKAIIRAGIIRSDLEIRYSKEYVEKLQIAVPSLDTQVQFLSGGNQQKVVIAKWLMQQSDLIFMDEPTRGVDVGAKVEIYMLMNEMIRQGKAVVMISSELPEILGMSDRIVIMHEGRIMGELAREEATQEKIMSFCI